VGSIINLESGWFVTSRTEAARNNEGGENGQGEV